MALLAPAYRSQSRGVRTALVQWPVDMFGVSLNTALVNGWRESFTTPWTRRASAHTSESEWSRRKDHLKEPEDFQDVVLGILVRRNASNPSIGKLTTEGTLGSYLPK